MKLTWYESTRRNTKQVMHSASQQAIRNQRESVRSQWARSSAID